MAVRARHRTGHRNRPIAVIPASQESTQIRRLHSQSKSRGSEDVNWKKITATTTRLGIPYGSRNAFHEHRFRCAGSDAPSWHSFYLDPRLKPPNLTLDRTWGHGCSPIADPQRSVSSREPGQVLYGCGQAELPRSGCGRLPQFDRSLKPVMLGTAWSGPASGNDLRLDHHFNQ